MKYCGVDLASKSSAICVIEHGGMDFVEFEIPTEDKDFSGLAPTRCLVEASPLTGIEPVLTVLITHIYDNCRGGGGLLCAPDSRCDGLGGRRD